LALIVVDVEAVIVAVTVVLSHKYSGLPEFVLIDDDDK
jgi:hypothetical protein